jgi:Kef-type K+ transport system membrane component KefB
MSAWSLSGGLLLALLTPTTAGAVAAEGHARMGPVLFALAVLVVAAKMGGLLAERWGQPSVLGELLVGIGLGNLLPPLFGERGIAFVRSDPTLLLLAEVGVLILLFDVGLESDLRAFARVGLSALLVAVIGTVVPFALGWAAAAWLLPDNLTLVHVFVGATLTATSVGITARVLKDLGVTQSPEGQTIIGAAILDDVLGLLVLAMVGGMVTAAATGGAPLSGLAISAIVLKAALFLGITVGLGHFLSSPIVRLAGRTGQPGILLVFGLALCFMLAFVAELAGLAGIVGAFAAGLLLDPYGEGVRARAEEATLSELLHPLSSLFVPLFFVLMGIQVDLGSLADRTVLGFGVVLLLCALAGKVACGLGVVRQGMNRLAVAFGMVPRGEVGLIFAGIGTSLTLQGAPLLSQGIFSAIVLMVLVTTLVAPVGLRWAFGDRTQRDRDEPGHEDESSSTAANV